MSVATQTSSATLIVGLVIAVVIRISPAALAVLLFQLAQGFDDRWLFSGWAWMFPYDGINPIRS